jgi:hypothetical protein
MVGPRSLTKYSTCRLHLIISRSGSLVGWELTNYSSTDCVSASVTINNNTGSKATWGPLGLGQPRHRTSVNLEERLTGLMSSSDNIFDAERGCPIGGLHSLSIHPIPEIPESKIGISYRGSFEFDPSRTLRNYSSKGIV